MTKIILEEMVCHTYKGILCKICEAGRYGVLFRISYISTCKKLSNYGCHKCIVKKLEEMIGNNSDENKNIQDLINEIKK